MVGDQNQKAAFNDEGEQRADKRDWGGGEHGQKAAFSDEGEQGLASENGRISMSKDRIQR